MEAQRPRSPDGRWEWDGQQWRPVKPPAHLHPTMTIQEQIDFHALRGYRVVTRTDTTAQLIRPKQFSFGWASFWFIFGCGIGIFFYLFYYLSKRDEMLYLTPMGATDSMGLIPPRRLEGRP